MKSKIKLKVLVAMSGGVDSSVATALLVKSLRDPFGEGYDVTGAFMVNYNSPLEGGRGVLAQTGSCWRDDYQDALRVAAKLGIKLLRLDFTKEYKKMVLDYMYREYKAGRTPNPDVLCNKYVKFGVWLEKARKLGFDYLATGHYAKTKSPLEGGRGVLALIQAKDRNKDQTYFLHQLSQKQLRYILFPIGNYNKSEVRELAKKFNLPTANKEESMGICFVGEVNIKNFLQKKIKIKKGDIILSSNHKDQACLASTETVIGQHDGLSFYTIGQRIGVCHKPFFVIDKNIKKNQLIVGFENDPLLYKKEVIVKDINWIRQGLKFPLKCKARLRHRQPLQDCIVVGAGFKPARTSSMATNPIIHNTKYIIHFTKPQRAITPGQFAVFYKGAECLGGGVVK